QADDAGEGAFAVLRHGQVELQLSLAEGAVSEVALVDDARRDVWAGRRLGGGLLLGRGRGGPRKGQEQGERQRLSGRHGKNLQPSSTSADGVNPFCSFP